MADDSIPKNFVPLAILSTIIYGFNEDDFISQLKEAGVLHFTDDEQKHSTVTFDASGRQLTRTVSINVHGRVEVERQFTKGIEKFTVIVKTKEPLRLETLNSESFLLKEKDIKLNFQLRNVELHDVNNFVIKGTKSLSKNDLARISFDLPNVIRFTCRYQIHGMVLGRNVHEGGNADIKLSDVQVKGRVKMNVTDESIRITDLALAFVFGDLNIDKVDLIIARMSREEVAKLFNETGKRYLKENTNAIAERISQEIKDKLNKKLKDISAKKIVNSVRRKSFLESTEDD